MHAWPLLPAKVLQIIAFNISTKKNRQHQEENYFYSFSGNG
jgi:hypothetical protein